jgi:CRP/FNR family transcriptional regulator, cyclic AMP receptor protein
MLVYRSRLGQSPSFDASPTLRALRRSDVFSALAGTAELAEAAERAAWITAPRRRELVSEETGSIFVIVTGRVKICSQAGERDLTLGYADPGDVVGEESLFAGSIERRYFAADPIEAVAMPSRFVSELIENHPKLAASMLRYVGERRASLERRLRALLCRSVESRVAEFVLEVAARYGVPDSRGTLVSQRFTHLDIANFVGSTRETVTLVLGDLKRAGLIDLDHRRLVVLDRDGLVARTVD